ncbi:vWA domain-containing protein [Thalassotalea atypica]|uniref:vWA domain-containing protein n=1 Tax=Thalassotalea atypica TaxID=2054316 RepID=UPI002572ED91|nr:VWA domain-containing protein [Thalassotalea atypica]
MTDYIIWEQFHFMRPLWLLSLVPAYFVFYWRWRIENKTNEHQKNLPKHLLKALTVGQNAWQQHMPLKMLAVVATLLIIVISGPTWQRQASPFGEDKAPLLVVLDVSASMLQTDVKPSRLARAKQKIEDILSQRNGGQTGLIVYTGSAHLAMPLTQDIDIFKPLLHAVTPRIMPRQGKFAEYTLPLIDKQFAKQNVPGTVLLVTDGIGSQTVEAFGQYFEQSRHQLLILAMGNDEKPSDITLDMDGLNRLASVSNAKINTVTIDNEDVNWIAKQINRHMQISADSALPWQDMGYSLTYVIAVLFLMWFRRGWLVQWSVTGILLIGIATPTQSYAASWQFADLWMTKDQQGQLHFNQGEFIEAAQDFTQPMHKATAYFYAEEYKKAHSFYLREDSLAAMFGAANALAHQREYIAARNLYRELVALDKDFPNAVHNLQVLQKLIDEINSMSESQANTENEASKELGEAPQTSDGADEQTTKELMIEESLSAEQILQNEALNRKWMERVQSNPERFLASKFQLQLQQSKSTQTATKNKAGAQE